MRMMTMLMKFSKGCRDLSGGCKTSPFPPQPSALNEWRIISIIPIYWTGSLLALRAPTSRWRPFVFRILLALGSCDPQQWAKNRIVPPSICNAHAHPSNVCACALDAHCTPIRGVGHTACFVAVPFLLFVNLETRCIDQLEQLHFHFSQLPFSQESVWNRV